MKIRVDTVALVIAIMVMMPSESRGQFVTSTQQVNTQAGESRAITCPRNRRVVSCQQISVPSGSATCITGITGANNDTCNIQPCTIVGSDNGWQTTMVCGGVDRQSAFLTTAHQERTAPRESKSFTCPNRNERVTSCEQISVPSGRSTCITGINGATCNIQPCTVTGSDTGWLTTIICGRVQ